jgi:hypothetical protein
LEVILQRGLLDEGFGGFELGGDGDEGAVILCDGRWLVMYARMFLGTNG